MAVPVSTHSKTAILSNGFIRKLVKFDHHYQQTQLQPDRLHHKIKINLDFMIEQPGNLKPRKGAWPRGAALRGFTPKERRDPRSELERRTPIRHVPSLPAARRFRDRRSVSPGNTRAPTANLRISGFVPHCGISDLGCRTSDFSLVTRHLPPATLTAPADDRTAAGPARWNRRWT
jgi:hypothetical protein